MTEAEIAARLIPLQRQWLDYLRRNDVYRTNEGTMGDTICSGMCSGKHALVQWRAGDKRGWDGSLLYSEQYSLTPLGRRVAEILAGEEA